MPFRANAQIVDLDLFASNSPPAPIVKVEPIDQEPATKSALPEISDALLLCGLHGCPLASRHDGACQLPVDGRSSTHTSSRKRRVHFADELITDQSQSLLARPQQTPMSVGAKKLRAPPPAEPLDIFSGASSPEVSILRAEEGGAVTVKREEAVANEEMPAAPDASEVLWLCGFNGCPLAWNHSGICQVRQTQLPTAQT